MKLIVPVTLNDISSEVMLLTVYENDMPNGCAKYQKSGRSVLSKNN